MNTKFTFPRTYKRVYIPTCLLTTVAGAYQANSAILQDSIVGLVVSAGLIAGGILGVIYHIRASMTLTERYIEATGFVTRRLKWTEIQSVSQKQGHLVLKGQSLSISISYPIYHWAPVARTIIPRLNGLAVLRIDAEPKMWGLLPRDTNGRRLRS